MDILLIGFRYHEIEEIQDRFASEFSHSKIDFAISMRDSWYRLKISYYDLIILDATCSEADSLVTYQEISIRSEGIPIVLIGTNKEIQKLSQQEENRPKYIFAKQDNYLDKIIAMLKKEEEPSVNLDLQYQLQLREDVQRVVQYFHTSINTVLDPLFIINNRFEIVEINNSFLERYNATRKEVIGKPCYQIIHKLGEPCDGEDRTCPIREVFRLGLPYSSSLNQLSKGNRKTKLIINATPIQNELNQVDEVVITFRTETVEKRTESRAIFNKSLLELMLSGLTHGLIFCNSENQILLLNQAAESILGMPKAKLINKSILELPIGTETTWLVEVLGNLNTDMRFNSLSFKARINGQFVQIRFAPIFGQENLYLGGFLYLTEIEESSKIEREENDFLLDEKIFAALNLTSSKIIAEG